jgi:hypothetical protein
VVVVGGGVGGVGGVGIIFHLTQEGESGSWHK